jgi:GNAT superfamily N-acetyltransferase
MSQKVRVIKLTSDQVESAAELLARAFHDQPYEMFYEPDGNKRMRILREAFRRLARHCVAYGEPRAAADSELAGVALWLPPGATHITSEQERECGLDQMPAIFGETAFARSAPLRDLLHESHERAMKEPHWYLPILGVELSRQGTGVGGALLRSVLARADEERLPCYLDTAQPRNVPFYQRHGFRVLTYRVEPVSSLPYWTFRRDPA